MERARSSRHRDHSKKLSLNVRGERGVGARFRVNRIRSVRLNAPRFNACQRMFLDVLKLGDLDGCFREVGGDSSSPGG